MLTAGFRVSPVRQFCFWGVWPFRAEAIGRCVLTLCTCVCFVAHEICIICVYCDFGGVWCVCGGVPIVSFDISRDRKWVSVNVVNPPLGSGFSEVTAESERIVRRKI